MQRFISLTLRLKHHTAASVITKQITFCQRNDSHEQIHCVESYCYNGDGIFKLGQNARLFKYGLLNTDSIRVAQRRYQLRTL